MSDTHFVIVTGMSGAGKSQALKCLEDIGFFCVDNLPTTLIPPFAQILAQSSTNIKKIALGIDIREGEFFDSVFIELARLNELGFDYETVFLDASSEALLQRYSETRRRHPVSKDGSIIEGIESERAKISKIRSRADWIIDTSNLNIHELKQAILNIFSPTDGRTNLSINVFSFGHKYGLPSGADLVFDVRFLPNPHYEEELRPLTGENEKVRDFVLGNQDTTTFLDKVKDLLLFLLPRYLKEGKAYLTIAVGCTGGRHRSVAIANAITQFLDESGQIATVRHRDIDR